MWDDLRALDERVNELDGEIFAIAASEPTAVRLQQLHGVGPMIATALIAAIGDASQFANGRQLAASRGLTPSNTALATRIDCLASVNVEMLIYER